MTSLANNVERYGAAAGLTLAGLAVALFFGSHLLAAEVSCAAFVLLAQFREPERSRRGSAIAWAGVAAAALAWGVFLAPTARADYAFRYSGGIGMYAPERSPEGEFRWSGRRSAVRLLAGERRHVRVVFRSPSRTEERLRVSSGGAELFSKELLRDRGARLILVAPPGRPAVFVFENSGSFRPSASGESKDSRELSLQVFSEP